MRACERARSRLTQDSDVDAGVGRLVLDAVKNMADVGTTLGHRSARKDQAGAHGCGGEDLCLRLTLHNLTNTTQTLVKQSFKPAFRGIG